MSRPDSPSKRKLIASGFGEGERFPEVMTFPEEGWVMAFFVCRLSNISVLISPDAAFLNRVWKSGEQGIGHTSASQRVVKVWDVEVCLGIEIFCTYFL